MLNFTFYVFRYEAQHGFSKVKVDSVNAQMKRVFEIIKKKRGLKRTGSHFMMLRVTVLRLSSIAFSSFSSSFLTFSSLSLHFLWFSLPPFILLSSFPFLCFYLPSTTPVLVLFLTPFLLNTSYLTLPPSFPLIPPFLFSSLHLSIFLASSPPPSCSTFLPLLQFSSHFILISRLPTPFLPSLPLFH